MFAGSGRTMCGLSSRAPSFPASRDLTAPWTHPGALPPAAISVGQGSPHPRQLPEFPLRITVSEWRVLRQGCDPRRGTFGISLCQESALAADRNLLANLHRL